MKSQTEVKTHIAKKVHRCSWCWQRIDHGESYRRYRYFDDGESGTVRAHPECYQALKELIDEDDREWVEWEPGQERP